LGSAGAGVGSYSSPPAYHVGRRGRAAGLGGPVRGRRPSQRPWTGIPTRRSGW